MGCESALLFRWDGNNRQASGASAYGMNGTPVADQHLGLDDYPLLEEMLAGRRSTPMIDADDDQINKFVTVKLTDQIDNALTGCIV